MHYLTANENTGALTMTSREIAEVVGSRHDKVKQSIERLADRGVIQLPPVGEVKNHQGQTVFEYLVSKRDSYVVVAQLSPEFTAKLVDRWQELESKNIATLPDFTNPAIAARAWADEVEQKQAALLQLESAKPAVEFVERYVSADSGSKGFRQVAKLLNANEREFRQFLFDKKIMYRLAGEWMPYGNHADAGRFEVKTGVADNEHAFNSAKFTAKGINWIAGKWAIHCIQEAA